MSSKGKGKEVATYGSKRKQGSDDGKGAKRNRTGVLQFFEDAADIQSSDESEESDFDEDDFMEELNLNIRTEKSQNFPFVPKDEVIEEEEFDRMMEERYKSGSGFVKYADDTFEADKSTDKDLLMSSNKAPTLWKVKCGIGRERHSVFCLMQKFVDLQSLGNKLQIISAFSVDHVKGFIYIEAEKQCDIGEACKGLSSIYYSRVTALPPNEISHLLSVRSTTSDVSAGMWARVKNGKYKGDLAQVVAVNSARKRATVKLIPRIDLQALAGKFGGGAPVKKNAIAAPRLISSSELEEFRPLIQYRCDRDTGKRFEVLDGLMLKDGFLYKKVSIDSLSFWGIMPQEEELLRFKNSESSESVDTEWLSQLYGDKKSKRIPKNEKGGGKGESSSSNAEDSFELYNLVCFGRKDFGLIVDKEKDDYYKILKEGSEGQVVVTIERRELKSGPLDARFSALDHQKKLISVNDTVKILEGRLKDKQGLVKQIYRGTVFIYDENETENGGYFCCRSQICEKIKLFADTLLGKDEEPGPFEFGEFPASPKSPLVEEKPWQARESRNDFNRDKDALFSIGQTLRIRVGPLKGYLCRVLAVRRSDVTVKLDSQQKVLTVKNEHLCEVSRKNPMASSDNGTSSFKPFDLLGSEGCSGGWGDGARASTETSGWNAGGLCAEGNSWASLSTSAVKPEEESNSLSKSSWDAAPKKGDDENNAWGQQSIQTSKSSWDTAPKKDVEAVAWGKQSDHPNDENNAWGQQSNQTSKSSWDTAPKKDDETNSWGKQSDHPIKSTWDSAPKKDESTAWGKKSDNPSTSSWDSDPKKDESNAWGKKSDNPSTSSWDTTPKKDNETNAWGQQSNQPSNSTWDSAPKNDESNAWGKKSDNPDKETNAWGQQSDYPIKSTWDSAPKKDDESNAWGKKSENPSMSSWDAAPKKDDENNAWACKLPQAHKPSWVAKAVEQDSEAATAKQDQDSAWGKKTSASQDSSWGNKAVDTNQESGCGAKGNWKSGSSNANQESGWVRSSNGQSGSGEATKDSTWSSGEKWNSRNSTDDQPGAKKSDWSTGAGESDWASKGSWKRNSASASQDSGWGNKDGWQSGSGDANKNSTWSNNGKWNSEDGNEDQSGAFGNRGNGGNWRGRGSGDRGGFRGRGRSDRGGFGGRGRYDTEGFGGRGGDGSGDRGGFRGRGRSDRGGYGGRGRYDTDGFGGRGGDGGGFQFRGERGRFGGRGRGRSSDWNGNNGGDDGKAFSWGKEANDDQGWKRGDSTAGGWKSSSWNQSENEKEITNGNGQWGGNRGGYQGRGDRGRFGGRGRGRGDDWNGNNGADDGKAFSWGKETNDDQGWKRGDSSSGGSWKSWNSGSDGTKGGGWNNQGSSGKDADSTAGCWKSSSWNVSGSEKETTGGSVQMAGWNKVSSGGSDTGGWNNEGSCRKQSSGSAVTNEGQSKSWNQTNAADGGQSSSWEQKKDANADGKPSSWGNEAAGDGGQSSAWNQSKSTQESTGASGAKPESSSWGKPSDGSQASGWNQSKDAKDDANASWGKKADWGKGSGGSGKGGW